MPVHRGQDSKGAFYQWGSQGAKYRYTPGNEASRKRAKQKAHIQGLAAEKAGYKEKKK